MRITSFQCVQVANALMAGQPLWQDNAFVDETFTEAYTWMRDQMIASGRPPPHDNALLFWGWPEGHAPGEDTLSPDERATYRRVTLDLPETDALLSDFQAWHVVLNNQYLAMGEADDAAPSASREDSWARIFTPDTLGEDYWGPRAERTYQACFWQPAAAAIVDVSCLAARRSVSEGS